CLNVLPAGRQNSETLVDEYWDRRVRLPRFVMPWADNDIFRNQIDSRSRSIRGCFPLSQVVLLAIDKSIAPHQHLDVTLAHQVSVKFIDGIRKEYARIFPLRRWRQLRTK